LTDTTSGQRDEHAAVEARDSGATAGVTTRRAFVRRVAGAVATLAAGPGLALACRSSTSPGTETGPGARYPLRLPGAVTPSGLVLRAFAGTADIGGGVRAPAWLLNEQLPAPLLRVRRGAPFRVTLRNDLPQHLILHWHGLTPPASMDGHPRLAVPPGGIHHYEFTVENRAGTYWYHPHTHMHTAEQTYRGIAGLLIVEDAEEDALRLPAGAREVPLILQDRRLDAAGMPVYTPFAPDLMAGYMGRGAFGNGIREPFLEVDAALYRFRILNGSNARIFRLGRSDGRPLVLIGNDGGLLEQPHSLPWIDVAPAERVDLLVDFGDVPVGRSLMLRSLPFAVAGGMGFMGGANLQGEPLDLLELRVARRVDDSAAMPVSLPAVSGPDAAESVRDREFRFQSLMTNHSINGRNFDIDRIDVSVPFGDTEIWSFVNESGMPHPVHLHATHFRVLSRSGGRGQVMPWERGLKDTVLLHPFETVRVAVRFAAHSGLFLLHCHNLEHEDMGMMANVLVE
jgi:FtsP/CotA-like multicopper oxidase with cupredoxin domain